MPDDTGAASVGPAAVHWTIDVMEEDTVAVEADGALLHLPRWLFPAGAREGDVVSVSRRAAADGVVHLRIEIDRAETEARMRRSAEQVRNAGGGDPGGDIVL